jgi:hypothetical protein
MGVTPSRPSTQWALSGGATFSASVFVGGAALGLTLIDVRSQIRIPMMVTSLGLGGGLKLGLTVSTESPSFFTTSKPLNVHDFDGRVTLASVGLTPGVGGSLAFITFWNVDHDPYWIDIGGLNVGVAAGADLQIIGLAVTFPNKGERVVGPPITP